jgi:hypothetical protein
MSITRQCRPIRLHFKMPATKLSGHYIRNSVPSLPLRAKFYLVEQLELPSKTTPVFSRELTDFRDPNID